MSTTYKLDKKKVDKNISLVESDFTQLSQVISEIIKPYCKSLDQYIDFISRCLRDVENPPTNAELEDFCMRLATEIYWAGGMCEHLGIKDDISKAIYKEVYNRERDEGQGTVADKNSLAELASQQEYLTNVCYNRAYKIMKSKVDNAQELLGSVKKVMSSRLTEMELTRMGGNT